METKNKIKVKSLDIINMVRCNTERLFVLSSIIIVFLFSSCKTQHGLGIEKRLYRPGYYISSATFKKKIIAHPAVKTETNQNKKEFSNADAIIPDSPKSESKPVSEHSVKQKKNSIQPILKANYQLSKALTVKQNYTKKAVVYNTSINKRKTKSSIIKFVSRFYSSLWDLMPWWVATFIISILVCLLIAIGLVSLFPEMSFSIAVFIGAINAMGLYCFLLWVYYKDN